LLCHDSSVGILEDPITTDLELYLAREDTHFGLGPEVNDFAPIVTLVLRCVVIEVAGKTRIVPRCSAGVVVDEIYSTSAGKTHLKARRERPKVSIGADVVLSVMRSDSSGSGRCLRILLGISAWIYPSGGSSVMIDKI
jgi:hypothetical protein